MTTQGVEPVVVPLYRPQKKATVIIVAVLGISLVYSGFLGIPGNWLAAALLGIPGLLLLVAAVQVHRSPTTITYKIVFDADGFHHHSSYPSWTVRWTEMSGITVHRREHRTSNGIGYRLFVDFWPATEEDAQRKDIAHLWNAEGAKGHFRFLIPSADKPGPGIEQGVATFRPDLWRTDTPE